MADAWVQSVAFAANLLKIVTGIPVVFLFNSAFPLVFGANETE